MIIRNLQKKSLPFIAEYQRTKRYKQERFCFEHSLVNLANRRDKQNLCYSAAIAKKFLQRRDTFMKMESIILKME